tara:strand:+ start:3594 stop:3701 length:108 start_codon:yes stop_codon:yes gene_type:complete
MNIIRKTQKFVYTGLAIEWDPTVLPEEGSVRAKLV